MKKFSHSGKLGDIIWMLPAMRELCGPHKASLRLYNKYPFFPITEDVVDSFSSLLELQDYIFNVGLAAGPEGVDMNVWWLDDFRAGRMKPGWNIPRFVCDHFGLPHTILDEPWLKVTPNKKAKYVFCKNTQEVCNNEKMPWQKLAEQFGEEAVFLGWKNEAERFAERYVRVAYYPTDNLLQAAEIIAGAEKVFCCQSVHHAIAEALKKDIMLECSPAFPSVIFNRPGVENIL